MCQALPPKVNCHPKLAKDEVETSLAMKEVSQQQTLWTQANIDTMQRQTYCSSQKRVKTYFESRRPAGSVMITLLRGQSNVSRRVRSSRIMATCSLAHQVRQRSDIGQILPV